MATRRMLAAAALGLFLAGPGLAKAQYNFTTIDVPARPGPQSTGTARKRLRESSTMRTATRMASC